MNKIQEVQVATLSLALRRDLDVEVSVFPHKNRTVAQGTLSRVDGVWTVDGVGFRLDSIISTDAKTTGLYPAGALYVYVGKVV